MTTGLQDTVTPDDRNMSIFSWANVVTVKEAAEKLGVSESRVRQLLSKNRIEGARRIGRDWIIPTPFEITPGSRGPIGKAGRKKLLR